MCPWRCCSRPRLNFNFVGIDSFRTTTKKIIAHVVVLQQHLPGITAAQVHVEEVRVARHPEKGRQEAGPAVEDQVGGRAETRPASDHQTFARWGREAHRTYAVAWAGLHALG